MHMSVERLAPGLVTCATCAHNQFVRGRVRYCHLTDRQMHEDANCREWRPTVVSTLKIFGGDQPRETGA